MCIKCYRIFQPSTRFHKVVIMLTFTIMNYHQFIIFFYDSFFELLSFIVLKYIF